MNGKIQKMTAMAALLALLLTLCLPTALAAPQTQIETVPIGADSFSITLVVNSGSSLFAGIQFGLTVSDEDALHFASFEKDAAFADTIDTPFVSDDDGVHYFGFIYYANMFSGSSTIGKLNFDGYTGNETVTVTITHMNVGYLDENNTPYGVENTEDVLVLTVRRASSSGGTGGGGTIVIDIPETDPPPLARLHYDDVTDPDVWYYNAVYYLTDLGLVGGVGGNKFSPSTPFTRGMAATLLYNMEDKPDVTGMPNPFPDVKEGTWYTDAVKWAADEELVLGNADGSFRPDNNITRQDLATLLARYADFKGIELPETVNYTPFADDADIAQYAKDAVVMFFKADIINGKPGNRFDPKGTSTRADVVVMMHRFMMITDEEM